jgi:hypothetical protein
VIPTRAQKAKQRGSRRQRRHRLAIEKLVARLLVSDSREPFVDPILKRAKAVQNRLRGRYRMSVNRNKNHHPTWRKLHARWRAKSCNTAVRSRERAIVSLSYAREGAVIGKVKVATKSDLSGIVGQVTVSVATAIALGLLGVLANWASQGGLVRLLGGISRTDDSIKLEVLPGKWSNSVATLADGSIVVSASQEQCPVDSIIIGGYCGSSMDAKGNLQNAGLFNGKQFLCKWGTTTNSETFKPNAQALCLRVARK